MPQVRMRMSDPKDVRDGVCGGTASTPDRTKVNADPFANAKKGKGRTDLYTEDDIHKALKWDKLMEHFLEAYCDNFGIELIAGTYRATVVEKPWADKNDEKSAIPVVIIDGPGAVTKRDAKLDPDSARLLTLPIPSRCMPGFTTEFSFESHGSLWLAYDRIGDGQSWLLTQPEDAITDASNRFLLVQFGDCGSLSSDQRKLVSKLVRKFVEGLASYLGGSRIGSWKHDWTYIWFKETKSADARLILMGPGFDCGHDGIKIDPDIHLKAFGVDEKLVPFLFNAPSGQDFPSHIVADTINYQSADIPEYHFIDHLRSTRFVGWFFRNLDLESRLPGGFLPDCDEFTNFNGKMQIQVIQDDADYRILSHDAVLGKYTPSGDYQYF